jgi:hypothetical protein
LTACKAVYGGSIPSSASIILGRSSCDDQY